MKHRYRLVATLLMPLLLIGVLGGTTLSRGVVPSRAAQRATSAVYLPLTMNLPQHQSPFGVQVDEAIISASSINAMQDLGVGWTRFGGISWRELQPTENGPIQWNSQVDDLFRRLAQAQIRVNAVVVDYPRWATTKPQNCSAIKPEKYAAFAAFLREVVNRYKAPEYNIHTWELGNEVDIDPRFYREDERSSLGCWGDIDDRDYYGGRQYGEMLKVVAPVMRAADPQIAIWHGGLLLDRPDTTDASRGKPELFLNGVLTAGAGDSFDLLPIHAYTYYEGAQRDYDVESSVWRDRGGTVLGKIQFVRTILNAYGQLNKPLFLNEIALLCHGSSPLCRNQFDRLEGEFYQTQSSFIIRAYARAASVGVQGLTWFCLTGTWNHSFLIDGNGPTPTYHAYKQLTTQMRYGTFKDKPNYASGVEAFSFSKGGGIETHIIWSQQPAPVNISVPQDALISAVAMDGTPLERTLFNGTYQLSATFEPIYVTVRK